MKFELQHDFRIESARYLPRLPEGHPCRKLHGHSFLIRVCVTGPLKPDLEWLIDFHEIKTKVRAILDPLDHATLNDFIPNPTTENLCAFVFSRLKLSMPELSKIGISETSETFCWVQAN